MLREKGGLSGESGEDGCFLEPAGMVRRCLGLSFRSQVPCPTSLNLVGLIEQFEREERE